MGTRSPYVARTRSQRARRVGEAASDRTIEQLLPQAALPGFRQPPASGAGVLVHVALRGPFVLRAADAVALQLPYWGCGLK